MRLRKTITPGAAPGGYVWDAPADVVDVPDDLAAELLAIPHGGFEPAPAPVTAGSTAPADGGDTAGEVVEAPKRRGRKPADQTATAAPQATITE